MGRLFIRDLEGRTYDCKSCTTKLAFAHSRAPRAFQCPTEKTWLFYDAVNIFLGQNEERTIMSNQYTIADVYCVCCVQRLGWKYVSVNELSQKFKEGKYDFERSMIIDSAESESSDETNPSTSDADSA